MIEIKRSTWEMMERLIQSCNQELLICSPWLSTYGLTKLQQYLNSKSIDLIQFWSRLADANTDSVLLLQMTSKLLESGIKVTLKDSPKLHAKVYLADRSMAILTSSNLSKSGFEENLEIATLISDPYAVKQVCTVVDSIEQEMQEVRFEDLLYFVEKQRPEILAQIPQIPQMTVVPAWRQERISQIQGEIETVILPPDNGSNPKEDFDLTRLYPFQWYQQGLQALDQRQNEISEFDLSSFVGAKIKIVIYPASDSIGWQSALWAKEPPFKEVTGKIIGQYEEMSVGQSFSNPVMTDKHRMTWEFLPKGSRTKGYIIANFPVGPLLGAQIHYVTKIELI